MSGLFAGVLPAVMTPFDAGLAIDDEELAGSVGWLIGSGVSGLVATGTMGEASALSGRPRESSGADLNPSGAPSSRPPG